MVSFLSIQNLMMWESYQRQIDDRETGFQKYVWSYMIRKVNQMKWSLITILLTIFRDYDPIMQQVKRNLIFEDLRSMKSLHGCMGVFPLCNKALCSFSSKYMITILENIIRIFINIVHSTSNDFLQNTLISIRDGFHCMSSHVAGLYHFVRRYFL